VVAVLALLATWGLKVFLLDNADRKLNFQDQTNQRVQVELERMDVQLKEAVNHISQSNSFRDYHRNTDYPYFVYFQDSIIYWSDFHYVPDYQVLDTDEKYKFVDDKDFQFISQRMIVPGNRSIVYMLLPLHIARHGQNNYIQATYNQNIFSTENNTIQILSDSSGIPITSKNDEFLFSINLGEPVLVKSMTLYHIILFLSSLAIICLLYYLYRVIGYFLRLHRYNKALLVMVIGLVAVRSGMLVFDFPAAILDFNIFNPQLYASSDLNRSLGDLFFNELVLLTIVIFIFKNHRKFSWHNDLLSARKSTKSMVSIAWILSSIFLLYLQYYVITLFYHSQWSLDIASVMDFNFVKFLSLLIIVINALIFFLITHVALTESIRLLGDKLNPLIVHYCIAALLFITTSLIFQWSWPVILVLSISYLTLLYNLNITNYLGQFNYISFLYLFLGSLLCAIVGAYAINSHEQMENINRKEQLADELLNERDVLGEFLLSEASNKIQSDLFIINQMMFNPYTSADAIIRKIERIYINQHLDRYDISISIFNSRGDPNNLNSSFLRYQDLGSQFMVDANLTEHQGLFFVNEITSDQLNRYLNFIEIKNLDITVGFVVLDLKLKRVIPNTVYPELLVHNNQSIETDKGFSYAIFSNGRLINNSGDFNYSKEFDTNQLQRELIFTRGTNFAGSHHLAVRGPSKRVAVISSVTYPLRNVLANFSFLFIIFIFCLILFIIIYVFIYKRRSVKLNYATRIQLYLNLAFFLPLIIVSVTTLSLISSYSKKEVIERYFEKAEGVRNNIVNTLEDYNDGNIGDQDMEQNVTQLSQYSELDINLFDIRGRLIGTSQPKIYENNHLSEFLNPLAYYSIIEDNSNSILLNESVGFLEYKSAYMGIKSFESGILMGVLSIPFFESKYELDKEIIVILINILNIFTFIFIVILIASYFASRVLTVPLSLITQKIKKTTLAGYNEPLEWDSDDEIGLMVGEYNRMLRNLEASKTALARGEKESAWREMAQQVAHEIKNPLTPMKLTVQHLKRTLSQGNINDKSEKPLNTLLQQIDTLSDIATSFSSFAKMPVPKNQRFEISSVLRKTMQLHDNNQLHNIIPDIEAGNHFVMGDAQLMGRIFSNLIINGIQSVDEANHPTIEITLKSRNNQLVIEFKDNGVGISEEIRDKIFIPNFSTKATGSGIGLSIAKRGIEHAGGKIWFETIAGTGTTIFVELPLVD